MQHFIVKWRRPRKAALLPELNTYPETPEGFLSGFYPGSKRVEGQRISFDIKLQTLPELNTYPTIRINQYPGWLTKPVKRVGPRYTLQSLPELNVYPQTVPVTLYPAWLEKKINKIQFKINNQLLPELNEYREVGSPYPSWLEKKAFKTIFKRNHLIAEELDFYPQIVLSPAIIPAVTLESAIRLKSNNETKRRFTTAARLRMVLGSISPAVVSPDCIIALQGRIEIDGQQSTITANESFNGIIDLNEAMQGKICN